MLFRINRLKELSTVMRFTTLWDITMVDTFEEYKEDLTLHCKRKYLADVQ